MSLLHRGLAWSPDRRADPAAAMTGTNVHRCGRDGQGGLQEALPEHGHVHALNYSHC